MIVYIDLALLYNKQVILFIKYVALLCLILLFW